MRSILSNFIASFLYPTDIMDINCSILHTFFTSPLIVIPLLLSLQGSVGRRVFTLAAFHLSLYWKRRKEFKIYLGIFTVYKLAVG